jgi:hypothetical protein
MEIFPQQQTPTTAIMVAPIKNSPRPLSANNVNQSRAVAPPIANELASTNDMSRLIASSLYSVRLSSIVLPASF